MLVVSAKIKQAAKQAGFRTSNDFCEALSKKVLELLVKTATSCRQDGMKTLRPDHLENVAISIKPPEDISIN